MNRRLRLSAAVLLAATVAYGFYRIAVHDRGIRPAIVTPRMDARKMLEPSLAGRLKRLIHGHANDGNRSNRPKLIALTFDDGPYPIFTPLLLDELRALHVHATFFLIGRDAQQWPRLTQRIERDGEEIGDHTYSHPDLDREDPAQVRSEIIRGRDVLYALVHDDSVRDLFRPPHGRYTVRTLQIAQALGYKTILWTDDPGDWRTVPGAALLAHIVRFATAPEILLLHSGKPATIGILPQVVARFRSAGYRFVTIDQLLAAASPRELNHPEKRSLPEGPHETK